MTLFTKTLNAIINTFCLIIMAALVHIGLSILLDTIQALNISYLQPICQIFDSLIAAADTVLAILILTFTVLMITNVIERLRYDSLLNWFKSFSATFKLRKFMKLEDPKEDFHDSSKSLKIYKQYNILLKYCFVDLQYAECIILIKVPNTVQVSDLLTPILPKIRDYIANEYPDYKFSPFKKVGKFYICSGSTL
ncbi:hypothetical protein ABPH35_08360 [Streptococcus sp. ZJ93]|uniref:hypothetical protein n=1 Tax=Streptococcus handemini TaxID=3161188 RepID=UPI0032EFBDAB